MPSGMSTLYILVLGRIYIEYKKVLAFSLVTREVEKGLREPAPLQVTLKCGVDKFL